MYVEDAQASEMGQGIYADEGGITTALLLYNTAKELFAKAKCVNM